MENTYDSKCKTDITKIKQDYRIETVDKSITVYSTIFEAMEKAALKGWLTIADGVYKPTTDGLYTELLNGRFVY